LVMVFTAISVHTFFDVAFFHFTTANGHPPEGDPKSA
jgi:hypothetical protein